MCLRFLSRSEWALLRKARLDALRDSPRSFLSTYADEETLESMYWLREFDRGSWLVSTTGDGQICALLGAIRSDSEPESRYLSYLWVAPDARRTGVGTRMVGRMLIHLDTPGVRRIQLWVIDTNHTAVAFYRRLGFIATGVRQPLHHGADFEELLVHPV